MNFRKKSIPTRLIIILIGILGLLLLNSLFGIIWPTLLVQAGPTLPPLTTPTSEPTNNDDDDNDNKSSPIGAYIELQMQSTQAGLWTVVQWQDSSGGWQDVEGWQGTLDVGGKKLWWVAAKDFGKGPFRWAVHQSKDGELLATSEPFYLPHTANETVRIVLSIGP